MRLALSEVQDAARAYGTALELDPVDPQPAFNLGYLFDMAGNRHRAAAYYETALARDPDYAPAQEALARLRASGGHP